MKRNRAPWAVALCCALLLTAAVVAQDQSPLPPGVKEAFNGRALYTTYCATCHGLTGNGDGPLAGQLRFRPPDLTQIAKRDRGKWDGAKVARIIDGRNPVKGHGGPDMPVWGDAFKNSRVGYDEESVKARVDALVDYLASVQEPAETPRN